MAYTIDPFAELERVLPKRQVANIRKLLGPDSALSPGRKIRVGAALDAIHKVFETEGISEVQLTKGSAHDAGVAFYTAPTYSTPKIREKVAESLLPQEKYPQAWRVSSGGGQVKADVGPYPEE